jgi:hypothetical protein
MVKMVAPVAPASTVDTQSSLMTAKSADVTTWFASEAQVDTCPHELVAQAVFTTVPGSTLAATVYVTVTVATWFTFSVPKLQLNPLLTVVQVPVLLTTVPLVY